MSLVFDNPVQPVLALPTDLNLWQRCASITPAATRWRVYLHQLAWTAIAPWLEAESGHCPQLWPTAAPLDIWQGVAGLALTLNSRRIVVILSEAIDAAWLEVPQEWVDIPDWAADYYLAAQVNVDDQQLGLWGYATYAQLKQRGHYAPGDRTYTLSDVDVIQDLAVFWVAQQLEAPQVSLQPALATLTSTEAAARLERGVTGLNPRLAMPFADWAQLFNQPQWRQQLWQRRGGMNPVNLGNWVEGVVDLGWRSLATLLPQPPGFGWRDGSDRDTVSRLGKVIYLDPAVNATNAIVDSARDPVLDPAQGELVLGLSVTLLADQRRQIQIQLFPAQADTLPPGVCLTLELSETAERLQTVTAGEQDNYIQLPSFRCPPGQHCRILVQAADAIVQEEFVS